MAKNWIVTGTSMEVEADDESEAVDRAQDSSGWHWEAVEVGTQDEVLYSITRKDLEAFAGHPVSNDMAQRFAATFHLTTVDQCIAGWLEGA